MIKKRWKLVVVVAIIAAGLLVVTFILNFMMIGPGLPPSINGWYFPPVPEGYHLGNTRMFTGTGADHFGMIGEVSRSCPDLFPAISQDCIYAEYERLYPNMTSMGSRYIVVSYYFNRTATFKDGEHILYQELASSGKVTTTDMAILQAGDDGQGREVLVPVTQFISNETSGYFIEYQRPLLSSREDYLIMYYGILGSRDLGVHAPFLAILMSKGGIPKDTGAIHPLTDGIPA
jgi:hypothetical protein